MLDTNFKDMKIPRVKRSAWLFRFRGSFSVAVARLSRELLPGYWGFLYTINPILALENSF